MRAAGRRGNPGHVTVNLAAAATRRRSRRSPRRPSLAPSQTSTDAKDLRSSGKLKLGQVVADFQLVAKTYAATHAGKPTAGAVFFARMEFSRAKDLFGRLGVQALPWMARVPPSLAISEGGAVTLAKEEVMPTGNNYPWPAEDIAAWVLERSGVAVGEVKRAPLIGARSVSFAGCWVCQSWQAAGWPAGSAMQCLEACAAMCGSFGAH